jgi:hypothetical protein
MGTAAATPRRKTDVVVLQLLINQARRDRQTL